MTKEEIDRLEAEEQELRDQHRALQARITAKVMELRAARLAYAEANPHPWIGKAVSRQVRRGYRDETVTRSGTVVAYDPAKHQGLRQLYAGRLNAGDPIVISKSGLTGWRLDFEGGFPGETKWELAE